MASAPAYPKNEELCGRTACCCFEQAFYCDCSGAQCCTCLADMTVGYDCFSNVWCDVRQHICCVDAVAAIPIIKNVTVVKKFFGPTAAVSLLGIVCCDCGPEFETGTQCCLCHNVNPYPAKEFPTYNDTCCVNSCFCCTSACTNYFSCDARVKTHVDGCSIDSMQQMCCCINHMACFPGETKQWPSTCSVMGIQCYPSCALEGCYTTCCGTFPTAEDYPEPSMLGQIEDYLCISLPAIPDMASIPTIDCSKMGGEEVIEVPSGAAVPLCDQGHTMELRDKDPYKGNPKFPNIEYAECDKCTAKDIYIAGKAYRCPYCTLEGGYDMCLACGNKEVRKYIAKNAK